MSALEMKDWIEQYDSSDITKYPVPDASRQLAATAKVIVSSNLPRALTSVQALGLKPALIDGLFCEAQLPYGHWILPRLSPFAWAFIPANFMVVGLLTQSRICRHCEDARQHDSSTTSIPCQRRTGAAARSWLYESNDRQTTGGRWMDSPNR